MAIVLLVVCFLPLLALQRVSANTCPDNSTQCTTEATCCQVISGQFGCCPIPNAVCCSDRQHCCPQGFTCILDVCTRGRNTFIADVHCPDGEHQCPDEMTCCKSSSSDSTNACCPLPDAVCCSDGQHCCPGGTTCDLTQGGCLPTTTTVVSMAMTPAAERLDDIPCSSTFSCPSGDTCCQVPSGAWGCCPLTGAVCCDDHVHCCPHSSRCGTTGCLGMTSDTMNPFHLQRSAHFAQPRNFVVCPGGRYQCPEETTCCKIPNDGWGCCPIPDAVCCPDGHHCCPGGMTCDESQRVCLPTTAVSMALTPAHFAQPSNVVVCPGGQYQCPDETTCCQLASGAWGCCPSPNAICCDDQIHCCPHGTQCGPTGCLGMTLDTVNPFYLQVSTQVQPINVVVCPGGQYECPDQTTCCKLPSDIWGCCPLPDAVCCDDRVHCCPTGYTCTSGVCSRANSSSLPWMRKRKANPTMQSLLKNV